MANKRTFLVLLKTFVREDWVEEIDEADLARIEKSYILQDFSEKEADIVYRLRIKDEDIIFYVLLELQSTVDHLMPFRLLLYMVEIWRDIYNNTPAKERERKEFYLPAIIPAVLYNGANNWTAAVNFRQMLAGYQKFSSYLLDFKYILFDVNRYREEELYRAANVIASVFALDQKMSVGELTERLRRLAGVLQKMEPDEYRQVMIWLQNVLTPRIPEKVQKEVSLMLEQTNPGEVEKMIYNLQIALDEALQEAALEGWKEGKEEGKEEGVKKVARNLLLRGIDPDTIAGATGLTGEEIEALKKELQ